MGATFSINDGMNTESVSYLLGTKYDGSVYSVDYILDKLKDNDTKYITEKDIRDTVFSLASSFIFKETITTGSTISYIGFDNLNINSDRDLKGKKILLGKRSYSGTYSYNNMDDIMGSTSSNHPGSLIDDLSDVDIFLYNTKSDFVPNNMTRIVMLAGTNFSLFNNAPYIQSQIETGLQNSLSLDFVNLSGDIGVVSDYGTVSVNNIKFPSISNSSASASNNKVLKWGSDGLYWDDITYPSLNYIGSTGSITNILGDPININNYSMEFSDSRRVPLALNGVSIGSTFSNFFISELLQRIVYPYLQPYCSIRILAPYESGYVEVGSYPTPIISYDINKKSFPTNNAFLSNMIPGYYPPITSDTYSIESGQSAGIVISPITATSTEFKISVSDGTTTASASTYITGIYPYFYGFSSLSSMTNMGLVGLSKMVESKGDKTIDINGIGNYFFMYDYDYGTLSNIYDNYGNTCSASFSVSDQLLSSPTGLWAGRKYYIYKWTGAPQIGPLSTNYKFEY